MLTWGQNQLYRRPALSSEAGGGTEIVHMYGWNYDSANEIPTETWTSVTGIGGGQDGYYENVFYTDAFSVAWDCATGEVNLGTSAEYLIQGWVQFWEDAVDGEQRFVAINFGSSNRHLQEYVANANSLELLTLHLPVHSFYIGTATLWIDVWHDHGSDLTVRGAEISVKRFILEADGTTEFCG